MFVKQNPLVSEQTPFCPLPPSNQYAHNNKTLTSYLKSSTVLKLSLLVAALILTLSLLVFSGGLVSYILVAGILALHAAIILVLGFWISSSSPPSSEIGSPV